MIDWTTVLLAAIGLAGTTISGIVAVYIAKISANTRGSMIANQSTAAGIEKVHGAVNGEREEMVKEIRALRELLSASRSETATLTERALHPRTDPSSGGAP